MRSSKACFTTKGRFGTISLRRGFRSIAGPDMKRAMSHILALLDPEIYNRNRIPEEHWRSLRAPTLIVAAVDHA